MILLMEENYSYFFMASTIGGLCLALNLYGLIFSRLIIVDFFPFKFIKNHNYNFLKFKKHLPLIIINLLIMCFLFPLGIIAISDFVIVPFDKFQILLFQIIVILIFDDFYFYWFHRLMHSNKFLFEKVHIIHHKASNPFPADYLYEHPVEWIIGLLGPFIGILIIGEVYFETIVLYLIIRILHELDIHSGLKSSIYRYFPFAGVNEYHALHHKHHVKHFASLFSFWDIIFKTHSKY